MKRTCTLGIVVAVAGLAVAVNAVTTQATAPRRAEAQPDVVVPSDAVEPSPDLGTIRPVSTHYVLQDESWALYGCWNPCKCPIHLLGEMVGGLVMTLAEQTEEMTRYRVSAVDWDVYDRHGQFLFTVLGRGCYVIYTRPAELATQRLILNLEYDGRADRFDSGEVPFGDGQTVELVVANNNFYCLNEAFQLVAEPAPAYAPAPDDEPLPD